MEYTQVMMDVFHFTVHLFVILSAVEEKIEI